MTFRLLPILAVWLLGPGFLFSGLLLATIPIIIHWLNRRRFKRVSWAAMDFLLKAMKRNRRRLQFESWLLLAVRCLVLALLGLALARPMGCQDTTLAALAGQRTGLRVIVIDNGYAMAYAADRGEARTDLDQAKHLALGLIDRLAAGGESVAIITTAKPARLLTPRPLFDLQAARAAVDRIDQSFAETDLPAALSLARQVADEQTQQPDRELDLIDNATRSVWMAPDADALAPLGRELAGRCHYRIVHFDLSQPGRSNAAITQVRGPAGLTRLGFPNDFAATVRGFGDVPDTTLRWKLDNHELPDAKSLRPTPDLPPITLADVPFKEGGPHVLSATLSADDRLGLDDARYRVVDVASELKVLIIEGQRGTGPLSGSGAFLQLALAPPADAAPTDAVAQRTSSYISAESISDLELSSKILANYSAVVLADVGQISPQEADQLDRFVEQGGALLIFMGETISGDSYNQSLLPLGLLPGPLTHRVGDAGGQKSYQFDFKPNGNLDPLLHAFAGLDNSGLDTAAVYAYWQLDLLPGSNARRVLNFVADEKGHADPAIVEQALGQGRVIFFATTANAQWTTLPVKPAYITLMHELIAGTVGSGDGWMNRVVGQPLVLPPSLPVTAAPTLVDPQQGQVPLESPGGGFATMHTAPLTRPGVYTLSTGARAYPIAVNITASQSDLRGAGGQRIRHALGDVDIELQADELPAEQSADTAGRDYGWPLMIMVLALLGAESLLARRFDGERAPLQASASVSGPSAGGQSV